MVGRWTFSITAAIVNDLPEPVMPEQGLEAVAPLDARRERVDRGGLVAGRREGKDELELGHAVAIVPVGCDSY